MSAYWKGVCLWGGGGRGGGAGGCRGESGMRTKRMVRRKVRRTFLFAMWQTLHMICQDLFYMRKKKRNKKK